MLQRSASNKSMQPIRNWQTAMADNHMQSDSPITVHCSHCGKSLRLGPLQAIIISRERLQAAYPEYPMDEPPVSRNGLLLALPQGWAFRGNPNTKCMELACSLDC